MTVLMEWPALAPCFIWCLLPMTVGMYTEVRSFTLYDSMNLIIWLSGLVYGIIQDVWLQGVIGSLFFFLFFIVFDYVLGQKIAGIAPEESVIGGGDVKMMAALGMWFGVQHTIILFCVAALIMIIVVAIRMAIRGSLIATLSNSVQQSYNYAKFRAIKPDWLQPIPAEGEDMPENTVALGFYVGLALWGWFFYTLLSRYFFF